MAELTACEDWCLRQVLTWYAHHGCEAVAADEARGDWQRPPWTYNQRQRALASLTSKGLLSKPRRGYYLPTEENARG